MRLSHHFALREFNVSGAVPVSLLPNVYRLVGILEDVRAMMNTVYTPGYSLRPEIRAVITSCYRSTAHNQEIGGARLSDHLLAAAVDVVFQSEATHRPISPLYAARQYLEHLEKARDTLEAWWGQIIVYTDSPHHHISLPSVKHVGELLIGTRATRQYQSLTRESVSIFQGLTP